MGGKALKSIETHRLDAKEYHELVPKVLEIVQSVLGENTRVAVIEAYRTKPNFGDMDILVVSDYLRSDYKDALEVAFQSQEVYRNGNVTSFDYGGFQIDVIVVTQSEFGYAKSYFAWNDLGNLVGRVADRLGFKHGQDGLRLALVSENQKFAEVKLTKDFDIALTVLGYDPSRFNRGFDTLEEMFEYAASSVHFHPWYYNLANRNAYSRNRDSKRQTYLAFLLWVSEHPVFGKIKEPPQNDELRKAITQMKVLNLLPQAREDIELHYVDLLARREAAIKINATRIHELTGLREKPLGEFIRDFKNLFADQNKMTAWANATPQADINSKIITFFKTRRLEK